MGLWKSQSGVPYDMDIMDFVREENRHYAGLLTEEWLRDPQRVGWAAQQSTRTGRDPADLIYFVASEGFKVGQGMLTHDMQIHGRLNKRRLGGADLQFYRRLRRHPFDEWVMQAEHWASELAGEGRESRPEYNTPQDNIGIPLAPIELRTALGHTSRTDIQELIEAWMADPIKRQWILSQMSDESAAREWCKRAIDNYIAMSFVTYDQAADVVGAPRMTDGDINRLADDAIIRLAKGSRDEMQLWSTEIMTPVRDA
jgi:hypothetical protein